MPPPIIDHTTLLVLAMVLMLGAAVVATAIGRAAGWRLRVPGWMMGTGVVVVLGGLSVWDDNAKQVQIDACTAVFDAYMERNTYAAWSETCSEVLLAAEARGKTPLAGLCLANASALLDDSLPSAVRSFESRFVFQEGYCRNNLTDRERAAVVAGVAERCAQARRRLALAPGAEPYPLVAYGRLCQDGLSAATAAAQ